MGAQIGGAETGDRPLATRKGEEELVIGVEKQVEAAEGTSLAVGRCRHLGDGLPSGIGIVQTSHEGEITVVGGVHDLTQVLEAVNAFA